MQKDMYWLILFGIFWYFLEVYSQIFRIYGQDALDSGWSVSCALSYNFCISGGK